MLAPLRYLCLIPLAVSPMYLWGESDDDTQELDSVVVTAETEEQVLEQSAAAVTVVNLETDQKLTADMGEVLSRVPGVSIRRSGGLGSRARFSLNGLRDDQIRFFIDGIPLSMSPYTFGISSIPVNLVERVDIYHGVVPISFGADALAGAVNLITEESDSIDDDGIAGAASLQYGDFNTWRSTFNMKYSDSDSGFFTQLNAFSDSSDNDYEVDVSVPNDNGVSEEATVKRFHDAYRATGANLDVGIKKQAWADLFQISLYTSEYFKEIQHSRDMSVAYGEPTVDRWVNGINLRYLYQLTDSLNLEVVVGESRIKTEFVDETDSRYNWLGQRIKIPVSNKIGEVGDPCKCDYWRDTQIARINLDWTMMQGHSLELSVAPTWSNQTSKNQSTEEGNLDKKKSDREMHSQVLGLAYTADLFQEKLQNTLFYKSYRQDRKSRQNVRFTDSFEDYQTDISREGWGNQTRYRFNELWYTKISYEYATRLPRADEAFGNSVNIDSNPELKEEVSHNYNISLTLDNLSTDYGYWKAEVNYFIRDTDDLISLRPYGDQSRYENIAAAESKGVHMSASWSSPNNFVDIDLNATYFDFINNSKTGNFEKYAGSRMPNVPYKFFNSAVGLNWLGIFTSYDEMNLRWHYRYVDEFSLFWDGVGLAQFNSKVATVHEQESHALALTYAKDIADYELTLSAEVQNLTDEKLYDYLGVQRPGRTFNVKTIFKF